MAQIEHEPMDLLSGSSFNIDSFGIESSETVEVKEALDNFLSEDLDKAERIEEPKEEKKSSPKKESGKKEVSEEAPLPPVLDTKKQKEELAEQISEDLFDEEEAPEETDEKEVEEESEHTEDKEDPLVMISKDLLRLGILTPDAEGNEPEITSQEDLVNQFNLEKKKGASLELNNFLSQFGEEYLDAFDKIFVKGLNPKEYYKSESEISDVRDLDLEDEDNQKTLINQYYTKVLGYGAERAKKKIDKLATDGELDDEATFAQEKLLTIKQQEEDHKLQFRQQEIVRKQQEEAYYNNAIGSILQNKLKEKDFDGIPVSEKVISEAGDYLITKKWKLQNGDLLSDFEKDLLDLKAPNNLEKRVKLALLMKRGLDLTKIKTKAVSEKTDALFESLVRKEKQEKKESKKTNSSKDYFNIQI